MAKITLQNPTSGYNLAAINSNFDKIETEFQNKVLYRNNPVGEPNHMLTDLDMNSNRILNLPVPSDLNEPARLRDVQNGILGISVANLITYTPPGTGGVTRTLQAKTEEIVSDLEYTSHANAYARANSALLPLLATPVRDAGVSGAYLKKGFLLGHMAIGNGMTEINSFCGLQGDEYYVDVEQEVRGISYVVRNTRTTPDEATLGWDFFGVAGVVVVNPQNTQYIRGNQKAVVGELYFQNPTVGSYAVKQAHNFQANIVELGANVTVENWFGLVVNSIPAGGTVENGWGIYIQDMGAANNAAAIEIAALNDGGRIRWPNVQITQNASTQLDIAGNTIFSFGNIGMGAAPITTAKLFTDYVTSVIGATEQSTLGRITASNVSGAVGKIGVAGLAQAATGYAGTGNLIGVQGQFNLLNAVTVTTGNAIGIQGLVTTNAAGTIMNAVGVQGTVTNAGGATVTNGIAFLADDHTVGTNRYGFYSNMANGFGFYAAGTAANYFAATLRISGGTAIPAGGTAGVGLSMSSTTNFGVYFGSGAPTLSAAKGSLYLRSDGSTTNDRMYVNTNGTTTWTAVTTAA